MNISIKSFFIYLGFFNVILAILIIVNLNELDDNSNKLKNLEYNRFMMIEKADELRQTSDDLTRFVRTYVITLNEEYKDNYYSILDIRNGKSYKPKNYEWVYWDLLEPLRSQQHPLEEKSSLKEEMNNLPYTKKEIEYLIQSEENSNNLVNLENEAFKAVEGLYKDKNGKYTVKKEPNQQLAIELLHSETYHKEKENIMFPINEFLKSINERTYKDIYVYNQKVKSNIDNIYLMFMIDILILVLSSILISIKILKPIKKLTNSIYKYKKGDKDFEITNYYDDEIGLMGKQFDKMRTVLDEEYETIQTITITDELTKIYNRKFYNEKVSELLSLYKRYNTPFSVIMYDIDDFKHINDTYGHTVGDKVLIEMSELVQSLIRDTDYLFRIGGEEFIILISETSLEEAKLVAEKIRKNVSKLNTIKDETITISLGLTEVKPNDTEDLLFQKVDGLLYNSKKNGKNRVSAEIES